MISGVIRKNVVFKDEKQLKKFEKFVNEGNFSSFSHMVRYAITETMKKYYYGESGEIKQLKDDLEIHQDVMYKKIDSINERIEIMMIRISKEGTTEDIGRAIKDILTLVMKRDIDHSNILIKCRKYDVETKNSALKILLDADQIGYNKKILNEVKMNGKK